jgi:uncharacterized membrane protein
LPIAVKKIPEVGTTIETQKFYVSWVMLFVVSVPLALNLVPPNGLYGFRIASTLANPETWRRGNVFAGWFFMVAAVIGGAITYFFPEVIETWGSLLLVGIVLVAVTASFVYVKLISW